ncbi:hypothetical protein BaRGS_00015088 [Batillaria attramentaria]|uniref:Uncharacterized protein n=1 Tax=Batillaria attramentaria TaxID=370345 RepID=A0ABD0L2S9_9CAEN
MPLSERGLVNSDVTGVWRPSLGCTRRLRRSDQTFTSDLHEATTASTDITTRYDIVPLEGPSAYLGMLKSFLLPFAAEIPQADKHTKTHGRNRNDVSHPLA